MSESWEKGAPGVLELPSGRRVRGRGLWTDMPAGQLPEYGLYLLGKQPEPTEWPSRWLPWPDFRLPRDRSAARTAFVDLLARAGDERVEVACFGGRGRTGTALACIAVLDGVAPGEAVAFVRRHYSQHAVETFRQRRFVARFGA